MVHFGSILGSPGDSLGEPWAAMEEQDLAGFGRIWQSPQRSPDFGKILQDLKGFGRIWQYFAGFRRIWQDLARFAGFGGIWQYLAGFCRI